MTGEAGRFGSVVTAMVTPFRDDDHAVDLDGAQQLASWLVDNGSDAIVAAGSTGESPTLSAKEKAELFRAVGEAIRGRAKLICGTGTYSTAETLELTEAAEDAGADGLLVVTPYYNKPPQRGLIAHFERVADATELPIIAYNIPGRTAIADRARHAPHARRAPQHRGGQGLDRRLPGGLTTDRRGAERLRGLLGRRLGRLRVRLSRRRRGRERREPPRRPADPSDARAGRARATCPPPARSTSSSRRCSTRCSSPRTRSRSRPP